MTIQRALIVDDSSTAQYRLKKMLRRYPLDIDIVDSGEAALRYLSRHAPAVIFMDHLMPGIDGFRALQIIKSNPDTAMIPVIMYTSKSGDVYTGQARALGAMDVMSKDHINATDLSKVLEAIHIYPNASADKSEPIESPELIAAANQVTDIANQTTGIGGAQLERRTASLEQARNLELRLSHMEHSLEDNRRFITSRVVRELQSLRKTMRQEFSEVLQQQPTATPPTLPPPEIQTAPTSSGSGWSLATFFCTCAALIAAAYLYTKMDKQLEQNQQQQTLISKQLDKLDAQANKEPELISPAMMNARAVQPPQFVVPAPELIEELAWTFNQTGALQFHQNSIDPQPLLRLHELLHRLANKGFKGTATVNIYVGDFCVVIDNMGMAQLAEDSKTLGDCMLSNEIYTINRLMDDYSREVTMMLGNLTRDVNSTLQISINATPGMEPYPERIPTVNAGEWNRLAQMNNRIELLLDTDPDL